MLVIFLPSHKAPGIHREILCRNPFVLMGCHRYRLQQVDLIYAHIQIVCSQAMLVCVSHPFDCLSLDCSCQEESARCLPVRLKYPVWRVHGSRREPDRVAYWADVVCRQLIRAEVCSVDSEAQDFQGALEQTRMGGMDVCRIRASGQRVVRTPAQAKGGDEPVCVIALQVEGSGCVSQNGRLAVLKPGGDALQQLAALRVALRWCV
jgi:hypothetical protein